MRARRTGPSVREGVAPEAAEVPAREEITAEARIFAEEKPVGLLISNLASLYQQAFLQGLSAEDPDAEISGAEHTILRCVAQGRGTSTEIARELGLSKQAIGKTVESLESRGYVRRIRTEADQRARMVLLTERGTRLVRSALSVARTLDSRTEGVLGAEDLARLRVMLLRLLAAESQIVEG